MATTVWGWLKIIGKVVMAIKMKTKWTISWNDSSGKSLFTHIEGVFSFYWLIVLCIIINNKSCVIYIHIFISVLEKTIVMNSESITATLRVGWRRGGLFAWCECIIVIKTISITFLTVSVDDWKMQQLFHMYKSYGALCAP